MLHPLCNDEANRKTGYGCGSRADTTGGTVIDEIACTVVCNTQCV